MRKGINGAVLLVAGLLLSGCAAFMALGTTALLADIAVAEKASTDTYVAQGIWWVCDQMGEVRDPKGGC